MSLKRVNKKLAIKLKEKGYKEPCRMMYQDKTNELSGTKMGMYTRPNDYEGFYAAPYLCEVEKWLREKKDIWISIELWNPLKAVFKVTILEEHYGEYIDDSFTSKGSYEHAQLAGINKALELI